MIKINDMLKKKSVKILIIAGIIKIAILLMLTFILFNADLLLSSLLFIAVLAFVGNFIKKLTLKNLFIAAASAAVIYNAGIVMISSTQALPLSSLVMAALDTGLIAIGVGYLMGVRK